MSLGQNVMDKMSPDIMSHGQNVTGKDVIRTKYHEEKMSPAKCNQTKCHTDKMSQDIMSQDMSQEIMSQMSHG